MLYLRSRVSSLKGPYKSNSMNAVWGNRYRKVVAGHSTQVIVSKGCKGNV